MFEWSDKFETHIDIVDTQHKKLVSLLSELCELSSHSNFNTQHLDEVLAQLIHYADQHFSDEEKLMLENNVDEKHTIIHKMEHRSFIYDVQRLSNYYSSDGDITEVAEKLVKTATAWLTYHILGIDQAMALQIKAIQEGMLPAEAYEKYKKVDHDVVTTRLLLDIVLDMWKESNERCHDLEQTLATYKSKYGELK